MVEFIRDVIIVVAILLTLIAVAVHPGHEAEANRHAESITARVGVAAPIASGAQAPAAPGSAHAASHAK